MWSVGEQAEKNNRKMTKASESRVFNAGVPLGIVFSYGIIIIRIFLI